MNIKFVNLARQNSQIKSELLLIIEAAIDNDDFILGKSLENFEQNFASYCDKKYAVGVNSGTDALEMSLTAYGIGHGDEVIIVPNSYFSAAAVIAKVGAIPKFVDIDQVTRQMDLEKLAEAISKKTRAIIPTHLYGNPVAMDKVVDIAKKNNLIVIEDACQAHGAVYKGRSLPFSETGTFSFYPGKNLGCFGDGGAVVTNNKNIYEKLLYLRNDGAKKKYIHKYFGFKSRLDTIQAEILNFKLSFLDEWNKRRRSAAILYRKYLSDIADIKIPSEIEFENSVFHLFVIETKRRNELQEYLKQRGIETGIHYPIPTHLQAPFLKLGYKMGDFPVTESKSKLILSLPIFPEITKDEIAYVSTNIKDF